MEINELTPAERRVWEAFPRGDGVDFHVTPEESSVDGADWGAERTLRAEVLRAVLLGACPTVEGRVPGLKVKGAKIVGKLDLRYAVIDHPMRLRDCWFERKPLMYGAQLRALVLADSTLPGLTASTLRVDVVLRLSCCRIAGPVRLQGSKISGGSSSRGP